MTNLYRWDDWAAALRAGTRRRLHDGLAFDEAERLTLEELPPAPPLFGEREPAEQVAMFLGAFGRDGDGGSE